MAARPIEEMAPVTEGPPEFEDRPSGVRLDGEVTQLLPAVTYGGDEHRHHRPVDRRIVAKLQVVPDRVAGGHDGRPSSTE